MSRNRRASSTLPTPSGRRVIKAKGPGDLVAAIPYMLGFTPTHSLVVVSLRGPRLRVGLVARADLPDEASQVAAARSLCTFVRRDGPREVIVLVYDAQPWRAGTRPWQDLVGAVEDELAGHHVAMREAVYVTDQRYWSYTCTRPWCCPEEGCTLAEAASSPVAAEYVLQGRSPLADRATLAARVAPKGSLATAAVGNSLVRALEVIAPWWGAQADPVWTTWQRQGVALFDAAADRYLTGGALGPDEAGRLLAALIDLDTRDVIAVRWTRWVASLQDEPVGEDDDLARRVRALAPAPRTGPDLADEDCRDAVGRLLLDLATCCDGPGALAPLTVLAMHAWSFGEGAQAGVAIDRALRIDPGYRLAGLVDTLLRSGRAPSWVAPVRADDEAARPKA